MLTLQVLLVALTSSNFVLQVFANDPAFCNNVAVCTPCNCNASGRCTGFCHHDSGSTGPKHCDLQAQGCRCPPGTMAATGGSYFERRGGCMSVGGRGGGRVGTIPQGACAQYNSYYSCVYTAPYYCRWISNTCVDIRGRPHQATEEEDTKNGPTGKA
ncbi:uncharacterized protein CTRU02_202850 [Colletotrichum truncatum]|uniref:Uncharacterized protein n=1 Tax=Colletotrichum truncatum TaxID=5467 RepID=A0ACC3ZLG8_COLTU|nr:uncharacterized protein CTRU02_12944 [Colletotrichum truncatum]KAF6783928.1 hypothetical protein CTRU02_12944 [Colletotrichum truncatum]